MNSDLKRIGIRDASFELWTVDRLVSQQIIDRPVDGNHGEIHPKAEDFVSIGVPFVMATDINQGNVDYTRCSFITPKQADSLRKGFAKNGDVLLTHKATIGRTAIVNYSLHPYVMLTPQVTYYRVQDHRRLNNRYLRYYFESELFQKTLQLWADSGATRAYLGITEQRKLPVILPPIEKQRRIAAILTSYDDLIETNQRRIALLERMAEEIYREWFVRLRFPGHKKTRIIKGVPQGWRLLPFDEAVLLNPPERVDKEDERPFVGMEDLSLSSMYFVAKERRKGNIGPKFRNGDVLFPRITPSVENGKRGLVMSLKDGEIAHGSTEFIVFREKLISPEHIYFLSCSEGFRINAELSMTGASGRQRVQEQCFSSFRVKTPPEPLRDQFVSIVRPMVKQIRLLAEQTEVLTRTRDLLVPRLISGKLRVDDLEIQFPPSMAEPKVKERTC